MCTISDWRRLRFLDESSINGRVLGRKTGRSKKGVPLRMEFLNASRRSASLLALTSAREGTDPLIGVMYDGAVRVADLLEFWQRPEVIASILPGDVVIMDNCRTHHNAEVLSYLDQMLRSRGARYVFLPPYYPHFNPIELVFGWIKHRLSHVCDRGDFMHLLECVCGRIEDVTIELIQSYYNKVLREMRGEGY